MPNSNYQLLKLFWFIIKFIDWQLVHYLKSLQEEAHSHTSLPLWAPSPVLVFSISMSSSELFIELDDFAFFSDPFFPFSEQPAAGVSDVSLYNDTSAPPCLSSSPPSMEMQGLSLGSSLVATQIPNGNSRTVLDHHVNASNFLGENSQSFDSIAFERSFISHSLDMRPSFLLQPNFSSSMSDSSKLRIEAQNPSEYGGLGGPMRRACSTGDLQVNNRSSAGMFLWMLRRLLTLVVSFLEVQQNAASL